MKFGEQRWDAVTIPGRITATEEKVVPVVPASGKRERKRYDLAGLE